MIEKQPNKIEKEPLNQEIHFQDKNTIKHAQEENRLDIAAIRKNVQEKAKLKETYKYLSETESEPTHHYLTKKLKAAQYKLTLKQIQIRLPKQQRLISSLIHRPTIETISEAAGKTIARPSGILGGGITALLGSLFILFIARKVGFTVPNSLFAILFAAGFVFGCLSEALGKLFAKLLRHS